MSILANLVSKYAMPVLALALVMSVLGHAVQSIKLTRAQASALNAELKAKQLSHRLAVVVEANKDAQLVINEMAQSVTQSQLANDELAAELADMDKRQRMHLDNVKKGMSNEKCAVTSLPRAVIDSMQYY